MITKKFLKKYVFRLFVIGVFFIGILILISNYLVLKDLDGIYTDKAKLPTTTIALVFGGGMLDTGEMSDMQTDRMEVAVELYQEGKVEKLFITGDDGAKRFDEVNAMEAFAMEHGVPEKDILLDPHGYNTFASCQRAAEIFELKEVVAISQTFHLKRIDYYCDAVGIDTIGFSADKGPYGFLGKLWFMNGREWLARVKAVGVMMIDD